MDVDVTIAIAIKELLILSRGAFLYLGEGTGNANCVGTLPGMTCHFLRSSMFLEHDISENSEKWSSTPKRAQDASDGGKVQAKKMKKGMFSYLPNQEFLL